MHHHHIDASLLIPHNNIVFFDNELENKAKNKLLDKGKKKRDLSVQEEIAAKKQARRQHDTKFLNGLKKSLAEHESTITKEYREYLMQGIRMYEDFAEHPRQDNFKDWKEETAKGAAKFNEDVYIRDQTYAWYFRQAFAGLVKSYLVGKKEFEEARYLALDRAKSLMHDMAGTIDSIDKFRLVSQQAKENVRFTNERKVELQDHSKHIEGLKTSSRLRFLQKGNIDNFYQRAQQRAAFLEGAVSAVVKNHQDHTENIIKDHISRAEQRLTAAQEKERTVDQRAADAEKRAMVIKNLSSDANRENREADLDKLIEIAKSRVEAAEERAEEAKQRATEAEKRTEEARTYGLNSEVAQKVAESARKIAIWEEQKVVQKANEILSLIQQQKQLISQGEEKRPLVKQAFGEELKARREEQKFLKEIYTELQNEARFLDQEKVVAQLLRAQAQGDTEALKSLQEKQETFQGALDELIQKERGLEAAVKKTLEANSQQLTVYKNQEKIAVDAAIVAEEEFNKCLKTLAKSEEAVAGAVGRNALSMKLEVKDCFVQAANLLDETKKNSVEQRKKSLKGRTKGHITIYADKGWCTINKVWMNARHIMGFDRSVPGQTRVIFRPDIVNIELEVRAREAKEIQKHTLYAKRANKYVFNSKRYDYELEIPDSLFVNEDGSPGRRKAIFTKIDKEKRDEKKKDSDDLKYKDEKEWKEVHEIDMEACGTLRIIENHIAQNQPVEVTFNYHLQTMPNPVIVHKDHEKDFSPELLQNQYIINLEDDRPTMYMPGDKRIVLMADKENDELGIDMTETLSGKDHNGLTLRENGTAEGAYINLGIAGEFDTMNPEVPARERKLKEMVRTFQEQNIDQLKTILNAHDSPVNETTAFPSNIEELKDQLSVYHEVIENFEEASDSVADNGWLLRSETEEAKRLFARPPRTGWSLDKIKNAVPQIGKSMFKTLRDDRNLADNIINVRVASEIQMKEYVQAHRSKDGPKKEELHEKLLAVEHFNDVFTFQRLENPGAAMVIVKDLAQKAGQASGELAVLRTQSQEKGVAEQKKFEQYIFDEVVKIENEGKANGTKTSDVHAASIRKALSLAVLQQAKLEAARARLNFAELTYERNGENASKNTFINDARSKAAEDIERKIVKDLMQKVKSNKKTKVGNDIFVEKDIEKAKKDIEKAIDETRKFHTRNGASKEEIHKAIVISAARRAARLMGKTENEIVNPTKAQFKSAVQEAKDKAQQQWQTDDVVYYQAVVEKSLQDLDHHVEAARKELPMGTQTEHEAADIKVALHIAAVEQAKLETALAELNLAKVTKNPHAKQDAYRAAMEIEQWENSIRRQSPAVAGPTQAHLWIDETTGLIRLHNDNPTAVHFYVQDIQRIGHNQPTDVANTGSINHTGILFKGAGVPNPAGGIWQGWDVHRGNDLAVADNKWTTRNCIYLQEPNGLGGHTDMFHLADGRKFPLDYIDWGKTEQSNKDGVTIVLRDGNDVQADLRGNKYNLKAIANDAMTLAQQNELTAQLALQEANRKHVWTQAVKVVAESAQILAEAQGITDKDQQRAAVEQAIIDFERSATAIKNSVENNLKRVQNDTADGSRGDIDEKRAVWHDYIQRYAASQERIAEAVKGAADTAEATAREIGKTEAQQKEAGLAAAQLVKERANMAQKDALVPGRDGLAAAVTAAEKASATEIAIAEAIKEAVRAGRNRAFETGKTSEAEQKAAGLAAAKSVEEAIGFIREKTLNTSIDTSRNSARNAARNYAVFRGITPDNAANAIDTAINARITQIDNNITLVGYVGDIKREAAKVVAVTQLTLIEEAKLNAAKAAEDLAITRRTENQARADAGNAIAQLDNAVNAAGNDDLDHGIVRTIAALEFTARLQAKAKAAKAAEEFSRLTTGEDNAAQGRAVQLAELAIDRETNLVVATSYAESQAQVTKAAREAAKAAREKAVLDGLLPVAAPGAPSQETKAQEAALNVKGAGLMARMLHPDNPVAAGEAEAEAAAKTAATIKGETDREAPAEAAVQAVRGAVDQVQTIKDKAIAHQEIVEQDMARADIGVRFSKYEVKLAQAINQGAEMRENAAKLVHKKASEQRKARKEGAKAVSDAINKEMERVKQENIRKHGIDNRHPRVDREAEYEAALKVAMETVIEQSINEITDGKAVKQAVSKSRDRVKNAAYKTKRDVIDKAEIARKKAEIEGLPLVLPVGALAGARSQETEAQEEARRVKEAHYNNLTVKVRELAQITSKARGGTVADQNRAAAAAQEALTKAYNDAAYTAIKSGSDIITQRAKGIEVSEAYVTCQAEIVRAIESASRDIRKAEALAGSNQAQQDAAAIETAKDVVFACKYAQARSRIEGKNVIEEFASISAEAAKFAAVTAKIAQSVEAASIAKKKLARLEGLPPVVPVGAPMGTRSQELEGHDAARRVLNAAVNIRIAIADAKISQAERDAAIAGREASEAQGNGNNPAQLLTDTQASVTNIINKVNNARAANNARSLVAQSEAAAEAAIAQATIEKALRDITVSARFYRVAIGQVGLNNRVQADRQRELTLINNAQIAVGADIFTGAQTAVYIAKNWTDIATVSKVATYMERLVGTLDGNVVANAHNNTIRPFARVVFDVEDAQRANNRVDRLTAVKAVHEVSARRIAVQTARLAAAEYERELEVLAGRNAGNLQNAAAGRGRAAIDALLQVNLPGYVAIVLPPNHTAQQGDNYVRDISAEATKDASAALREASARAKILEAAKKVDKYAREVSRRANRTAAQQDTDAQAAIQALVNAVNAERNVVVPPGATARDATVEAVKAALQEATAQAKILKAVIDTEESAKKAAQIANRDQVVAGRDAARRVWNVVRNTYNAAAVIIAGGGAGALVAARDTPLEAVRAAQKFAESEAQITKAIERLTGQANTQANARTVLDTAERMRQAYIAGNPAAQAILDLAINPAQSAARVTEKLIRGIPLGAPGAPGPVSPEANARADAAAKEIRDAVDEVPQVLNGDVANAHAEFKHFLDGTTDVLRNKEIANAISDAAISAAAAEETIGGDATAQAQKSSVAVEKVIKAAVTTQNRLLAAGMDKDDAMEVVIESANAVAARYAQKHAVAVSAKEIKTANMAGQRAILQANLADAQANRNNKAAAYLQAEQRLFICRGTLRTTLQNTYNAALGRYQAARNTHRAARNAYTVARNMYNNTGMFNPFLIGRRMEMDNRRIEMEARERERNNLRRERDNAQTALNQLNVALAINAPNAFQIAIDNAAVNNALNNRLTARLIRARAQRDFNKANQALQDDINDNERLQKRAAEEAIGHLDNKLRDEALRKAGFQANANGAFEVNQVVAQDSLMKRGEEAIRRASTALDQEGDALEEEIDVLRENMIKAANEERIFVEAAGGDIVDQALTASTIVEYFVTTEEAIGEATAAAEESLDLAGEEDKEKKVALVKATRKSVKDAFETAQKDAEQKGLSKVEQYAAGATAASKVAAYEKAIRDAALAARETAEAFHLDEDYQKYRAAETINIVRSAFVGEVQKVAESIIERSVKEVIEAVPLGLDDATARKQQNEQIIRNEVKNAEIVATQNNMNEKQKYILMADNAVKASFRLRGGDLATEVTAGEKARKDIEGIIGFEIAFAVSARIISIEQGMKSLVDNLLEEVGREKNTSDTAKENNISQSIRLAIAAQNYFGRLYGADLKSQMAAWKQIKHDIVSMTTAVEEDLRANPPESIKVIRKVAKKAQEDATPADHLLNSGDPIVPLMKAAAAAAREASRLRQESPDQQDLKANEAELKVRGAAEGAAITLPPFHLSGNPNAPEEIIRYTPEEKRLIEATREKEAILKECENSVMDEIIEKEKEKEAYKKSNTIIEQAIRGVFDHIVPRIRKAAEAKQQEAATQEKNLLEQNVAGAAEAARFTKELARGNGNEQNNAKEEARKNVEDTVATTRRNAIRAGRGTTVQSGVADKGGQYVIAQAETAQAVATLVSHISARVDHFLGTAFVVGPGPNAQQFSEVPYIPANPRGPAGEAQAAYRTRVINQLTRLATKNLMNLVTSIQAEADQPDADVFAIHEKAAKIATDSVTKLPNPGGMIGPMLPQVFLANKIAPADTKAIGVTSLSKQYVTLATDKDALIDDSEELEETFALDSIILGATATLQAHAAEAAHTSAEIADEPPNIQGASSREAARNIESATKIAEKGASKKKSEQATAAFKAGIQATVDIVAVEDNVCNTANTTEAVALSLGRDGRKEAQASAKDVRGTISTRLETSLRKKGEEVKKTVIAKVLNDLADPKYGRTANQINNAIQAIDAAENNTSLKDAVDTAYTNAFNAAAHRGVVAQYLEATAATTAAAFSKAAKYAAVVDETALRAIPGLVRPVLNIPRLIARTDTKVNMVMNATGDDAIQNIEAVKNAKKINTYRYEFRKYIESIANMPINGGTIPAATARRIFDEHSSLLTGLQLPYDECYNRSISNMIKEVIAVTGGDDIAQNTAIKNWLQSIEKEINGAAQYVKETVEDVRDTIDTIHRETADQAGKNQTELARTLEVMYPFMQEAATVTVSKAQDYLEQIEPILKNRSQESYDSKTTISDKNAAYLKTLERTKAAIITILQADKDRNHAARDLDVLVPGDSIDIKNLRNYGSKIPLNLRAMETLNGGSKDYEVQIAAYAEEARHIAQTMVALRDGIESLTQKIRKHVDNVFGTPEQQDQAATKAANFVVEEIEKELTRAKTTNPDLDVYQQASIIGRILIAASTQALTDVLATKTIETIQTETIKESNVSSTPKNPFSLSKALDLFADYDKFVRSKDPAERQYLKDIEETIDRPEVHYYHRNQLNLKRAIVAAVSDYNGPRDINKTIEYITRLEQGDAPDSNMILGGHDRKKVEQYHQQFFVDKVKPDKSLLEGCDPKSVLQYHRQALEFEWVGYLHGALARANEDGRNPEHVIYPALGRVKKQLNTRLHNLKRVDFALKPRTMSEEEDRLMDEVQFTAPPIETEDIKTKRKSEEEATRKREEKEASKFDPKKLIGKSKQEIADDTAEAMTKLSLEARDFVLQYVDGITDKVMKRELKARIADLIKEETQRRYDFFKLEYQKQDKWESFYEQLKEADKRFWRGFWRDFFFIYLKADMDAGNKFADKMTDGVMKLLMGALK